MDSGRFHRLREPRFALRRFAGGSARGIADDVRAGLTASSKTLPPKYFYDARGAFLFEQICRTPEYYPTRTEDALLARVAADLVERVRPAEIVELGSGDAHKTEHLLAACAPRVPSCRYLPVDICADTLLAAATRLRRRFPWLEIEAWAGDYTDGLMSLEQRAGTRLFLFLGGTIGNFDEAATLAFLRRLRAHMSAHDRFLLGVDRVKDAGVLHAAYNDALGYTAAFNLNILDVVNRELDAEFERAAFAHVAFYNAARARIEMHLRAHHAHAVAIRALDMRVEFAAGETILTEISRKFTPDSLAATLRAAGFALDAHYQPDDGYFSLALLRPARSMEARTSSE